MRPILGRKAYLAFLSAVLVFLAAASPSKADTVFTNFGSPGQTYQTGNGYQIGFFGTGSEVLAIPVIPSQTATLTDAMLACVC